MRRPWCASQSGQSNLSSNQGGNYGGRRVWRVADEVGRTPGSVLQRCPSSRSRWVMAHRLEEQPCGQHKPTDLLATGNVTLSTAVYPLAIVIVFTSATVPGGCPSQKAVAVLRPSRNSFVVNAG